MTSGLGVSNFDLGFEVMNGINDLAEIMVANRDQIFDLEAFLDGSL